MGKLFKLPERLKVGGHIARVKFPYVFQERSDAVGQNLYATGELRVSAVDGAGLPRDWSRIIQTFTHEVGHEIDKVYNADGLTEEQNVRLTEGWHQVLVDNPAYLRLYLAEAKRRAKCE